MRILLSLVLSCIAAAASAQAMVWQAFSHDFGAFSEDLEKVSCTFKAVNVSNAPVSIISSRANCGCTVPSYTHEAVQPGDTLTVNVAFDANGRPGRFHKKVFIDTSDGAKTTLGITGTVVASTLTRRSRYPVEVGDVSLSNRYMPLGSTMMGGLLSGGINIYNSSSRPITPVVKDVPDYMHVAFKPAVIPVGEQGFLSLTARTARQPLYGTVNDSFILIPDSASAADSLRVEVAMIVKEDFRKLTPEQLEKAPRTRLSTDVVDFDRIAGEAPLTQTLTITNDGREPLIIRRVATLEPAIKVDLSSTEVAPGKEAVLTVTLSPLLLPQDKSPLNARINLVINDPASPTPTLRVVGTR